MCGQADKQLAEKKKRMYDRETKNQVKDYLLGRLRYGQSQNITEKASVLHKGIDLINDLKVEMQGDLDKYEVK
ncbi:hypothetical protein DY124_06240 [Apilactobacillus micheneri]|nr:hypothetical protein DY124_06240 [Apilactobacillus micheneri]TPR47261.1 hypothetical protein DY125_06735 [Apilactobacillus micheneri]